MYQIKATLTFDKDIEKLDSQIAKRIIKKIEYLANHPEILRFPVKYLPKHLEGLQKYQVGDWRVLFFFTLETKTGFRVDF